MSPDSTEIRRHVESIKRLAEASVQVIRNMSLLLRPSMLDDLGLAALTLEQQQAREVFKRTGLRVRGNGRWMKTSRELPDGTHKTCIFIVWCRKHSIIAARHAPSAHKCNGKWRLPTALLEIVLTVEDDERPGFERPAGPRPGAWW